MNRLYFFLLAFSFLSVSLKSQKKPLDHSVYDAWQNIGDRKISNNGKWIAYSVDPQEGNSRLVLSDAKGNNNKFFDRGSKSAFTSDSGFLIFTVKPFYKDIKAVKDKKLKKEKLVKDSLFVMNLAGGNVSKIPNVQSYKIPEKGGAVLAYLLENLKDKSPAEATSKDGDDEKKDEEKAAKPSTLVLKNLKNGKTQNFENVIRYEFSENGRQLAFITKEPAKKDTAKAAKKDKSKPVKFAKQTVNRVDVENGTVEKLEDGNADFSQLTFDKTGTQLSFLGTFSAENDLLKDYQLYFFNGKKKTVIDNRHANLPSGWVLSENRQPLFSKNGKQMYFGIAPKPIAKDTALIANDHAILDVWSYTDNDLQPIQLKNLNKDLKKSWFSVIQTANPSKFTVLGNEKIDTIAVMNEGNAPFVLAMENLESRKAAQWEGSDRKTFYLVNTTTGREIPVVKGLYGSAYTSPLGKYVVYFNRENGNWYSFEVASGKKVQLNKDSKLSFVDEEFDMPDRPGAYGLAGWTENDASVIIRDRYDLWEFSPNGKSAPRNLTNGIGRKNKITFNTYIFDKENPWLKKNQAVYLSGFDNETKEEGIWRKTIGDAKDPVKVFSAPIFGLKTALKAKNAEEYIFTKEDYAHSPNLFATSDFKNQTQLSNINPQQANYLWGSSEIVKWQTPNGFSSSGILYKPENFDANKKYPMIVYFYEKLSDGLHRYIAPAPTPSRLNISYFVSNGYLVFTPDISYISGQPGKSAVEYINSGVEFLKKNPWVDGSHIGIQGQSWGGYQVAYLITENNMYAAAWAGAPVANMTSAYGGIRWSTGMNRQFQYEKSQSRIGKTLWEARDLYIENSPLFRLDRVSTPVVIMANDKDGAVPWYQGIEMFTALQRLGKKVWMLNYNGDDHNLVKRQNRKDIQIREQQFFDHYLKGAPAPAWMTRGIPATMKGKDWGFDLTDDIPENKK